ncbi:DUF4262 domain-containing protein [Candidatus Albibeggiatoa sp. nov. BB20]|uniref:DUF4262 domain-containing protein n=1 Tax=Candidatus Albibeggiatoa sp. nov. BB20 TaxID=3162723 RepID=UPI003365351C
MDKHEQKALDNIEKYGCHILHIFAEDDLPRFTYSVGIQHKTEHPDLVIMGLKQNLAHWIINEYNTRINAGEIFELDQYYSGFLGGGFEITFKKVAPEHYPEYFGWNIWYNKGSDFDIWQLVFPTVEGIWPWDEEASTEFKQYQPMLYKT